MTYTKLMVHNNNRIFYFIVFVLLAVETRYYVNFITGKKGQKLKVHNNNRIFHFIVFVLLAVETRYYVNFITGKKGQKLRESFDKLGSHT